MLALVIYIHGLMLYAGLYTFSGLFFRRPDISFEATIREFTILHLTRVEVSSKSEINTLRLSHHNLFYFVSSKLWNM